MRFVSKMLYKLPLWRESWLRIFYKFDSTNSTLNSINILSQLLIIVYN